MSSNCNKSTQSSGLYVPPHLRKGYVNTKCTFNNNISTCMNNNSMVKHNLTINNEGSSSKLYVPPPKRNTYKFGLSTYFDYQFKGNYVEYMKKLEESTTIYVGNLNLDTTESDIHKLFSKTGNIKKIIMGLDKKTLGPGGFCFIEYETHSEAENCMKIMQNILLDGNKVFIDWDAGFIEGRQYRRTKKKAQNYTTQMNTNVQKGNHVESTKKIEESTTLYVGNLNLDSTNLDIYNLFSKAGVIKTIVMGFEKSTLIPGGFCFVEYETILEAQNCMSSMQGALLNGNKLFLDWDTRFLENRQYKRTETN